MGWSGVRSSLSTSHAVGAEFERLRVCYGGVLLKGCSHSHDSLRPYRTIRSQNVTVLSSIPSFPCDPTHTSPRRLRLRWRFPLARKFDVLVARARRPDLLRENKCCSSAGSVLKSARGSFLVSAEAPGSEECKKRGWGDRSRVGGRRGDRRSGE